MLHWRGEARDGLEALQRVAPGEPLIEAELARMADPGAAPGGLELPVVPRPERDVPRAAAARRPALHRLRDRGRRRDPAPAGLPPARTRHGAQLALAHRRRCRRARAEDALLCHDYLSVAVEFENGRDLTWFWSAALPVETQLRLSDPAVESARDASGRALGQRGARAVAAGAAQRLRRLLARDRRAARADRRGLADRGEPVPARARRGRVRGDRRCTSATSASRSWASDATPWCASSRPRTSIRRAARGGSLRARGARPRALRSRTPDRHRRVSRRAARSHLSAKPHAAASSRLGGPSRSGFVLAQRSHRARRRAVLLQPAATLWRSPLSAHACAGSEDPLEVYRRALRELGSDSVADGFLDHGDRRARERAPAHDALADARLRAHFALRAARRRAARREPYARDLEIREAGEKELDGRLRAARGAARLPRARADVPAEPAHAAPRAGGAGALAARQPRCPTFLAYRAGRPLGLFLFAPAGTFVSTPFRATTCAYLLQARRAARASAAGAPAPRCCSTRSAGCAARASRRCGLHYLSANPSGPPFWTRHGFRAGRVPPAPDRRSRASLGVPDERTSNHTASGSSWCDSATRSRCCSCSRRCSSSIRSRTAISTAVGHPWPGPVVRIGSDARAQLPGSPVHPRADEVRRRVRQLDARRDHGVVEEGTI